MSKPAGIVLAGGDSRRMGKDKALVTLKGSSLIEHCISTLQDLAGLVIVVGPSRQRMPDFKAVFVEDIDPGLGPLGGIYTGMLVSGAEWNLVLACDMPFITRSHLEILLQAGKDAAAVVMKTDSRIQPLPVLLKNCCKPVIEDMIKKGCFEIRRLFELVPTAFIEGCGEFQFQDIDTPEDLARARQQLGDH